MLYRSVIGAYNLLVKNKNLVLLLILLLLISIMLLVLMIYQKNLTPGTEPVITPNKDELPPDHQLDNFNRYLNQDTRDIPDGFASLKDYFDEKNKSITDDCYPIEYSEPESDIPDPEDPRLETIKKIRNNFNVLPNDPSNTYYLGTSFELDPGFFCAAVNIEKENKKAILYLDKNQEYKKVDL